MGKKFINNKKNYLDMGYKEMKSESDETDTLFKQFDNGNAWIVQFNEEVQPNSIGQVHLTKRQIEEMGIFK